MVLRLESRLPSRRQKLLLSSTGPTITALRHDKTHNWTRFANTNTCGPNSLDFFIIILFGFVCDLERSSMHADSTS